MYYNSPVPDGEVRFVNCDESMSEFTTNIRHLFSSVSPVNCKNSGLLDKKAQSF
jgi:hypothetical protein